MDEAARALGIDPLELRLRNLARTRRARSSPATRRPTATGPRPSRRAAEHDRLGDRRRRRAAAGASRSGSSRARRPASPTRPSACSPTAASSSTPAPPTWARAPGRSSPRSPPQELGAPLDWVTVVMGDTAVVPYDQQTSASRSSVLMGNAVLAACRDIQAKLAGDGRASSRASTRRRSSSSGGEVRIGDRALADPRRRRARASDGWAARSSASARSRKEAEPDHPLGGTAAFYEFNCTAVEVEVDRDTGDVTIHRHVTVSDVGKALNPAQVRGQDEGAAVMGLGHTLMEHYIFDDDGPDPEPRRDRLPDPDLDGPADVRMESDIDRERATGPGPYGAKGMSEGALLPRRAGGRRGRPRRDRRRDPRPAALARAGLAGAPGASSGREADLPARSRVRAAARGRPRARRRQGREPRRDARDLGLPVPPGFVDHDRDLPGLPGRRLARRPRRGAPGADGRGRGGGRAAVRRRRGPAAGQRPVGGAGVDARDDGHDPRPRPERRDRAAAWRAATGDPAFAADVPRPVRGDVPLDRRRR